jgi:hypothetical protein
MEPSKTNSDLARCQKAFGPILAQGSEGLELSNDFWAGAAAYKASMYFKDCAQRLPGDTAAKLGFRKPATYADAHNALRHHAQNYIDETVDAGCEPSSPLAR